MTLLMTLLLSFTPAQAQEGKACVRQFSANLSRIQWTSQKLSPTCWRETQKGEGNADTIVKVCSEKEVEQIMKIKGSRDANASLCQSHCRDELNKAKLCVAGRPLSYYVQQARNY